MSVTFEEFVSLGDKKEVYEASSPDETIPIRGTIIGKINTVKKFIPGEYKIMITDISSRTQIAILYHASVDPMKIKSEFGKIQKDPFYSQYGEKNLINRYDWLTHCRGGLEGTEFHKTHEENNPGVDCNDVYLMNTSARRRLKDLKPGEVRDHPEFPSLVKILEIDGKAEGFVIARWKLKGQEYDYGVLFEEKNLNQYFALVYHDMFEYNDVEEPELLSVHHLQYPLEKFQA